MKKHLIDEWGNVLAILYVIFVIFASMLISAKMGANEHERLTGETVSTWDYMTGNFNEER